MKPFTPDGSLHDLTTYGGRVAHYFDMVDLRNAFTSSGDVTAAASLLAAHKAGRAPVGTSDARLWEAKKSAWGVWRGAGGLCGGARFVFARAASVFAWPRSRLARAGSPPPPLPAASTTSTA